MAAPADATAAVIPRPPTTTTTTTTTTTCDYDEPPIDDGRRPTRVVADRAPVFRRFLALVESTTSSCSPSRSITSRNADGRLPRAPAVAHLALAVVVIVVAIDVVVVVGRREGDAMVDGRRAPSSRLPYIFYASRDIVGRALVPPSSQRRWRLAVVCTSCAFVATRRRGLVSIS